jgi:hypothetical protein
MYVFEAQAQGRPLWGAVPVQSAVCATARLPQIAFEKDLSLDMSLTSGSKLDTFALWFFTKK